MIARLWAMIKARPLMWGVIAVVTILIVLFLARRRGSGASQETTVSGDSENVRLAEIAASAQGNQVQAAMIAAQQGNASAVEIEKLRNSYSFEALKVSGGFELEKARLDAQSAQVISTLQAQAAEANLNAVREVQIAGIASQTSIAIENELTSRTNAYLAALSNYNMVASQPKGIFGGQAPRGTLVAPKPSDFGLAA